MILKILEDKKTQLIQSEGKQDAKFCKDDIDVLMNVNELRVFKMSHTMPTDFQYAKSKQESIDLVLHDGSLYRVLEYCIISQPVLQISVRKVFKNWRFINGKYAIRRN